MEGLGGTLTHKQWCYFGCCSILSGKNCCSFSKLNSVLLLAIDLSRFDKLSLRLAWLCENSLPTLVSEASRTCSALKGFLFFKASFSLQPSVLNRQVQTTYFFAFHLRLYCSQVECRQLRERSLTLSFVRRRSHPFVDSLLTPSNICV